MLNAISSVKKYSLYVTGSAKRGLIADPNCTYLDSHNLTCELKLRIWKSYKTPFAEPVTYIFETAVVFETEGSTLVASTNY